jgi:hypothetical protein
MSNDLGIAGENAMTPVASQEAMICQLSTLRSLPAQKPVLNDGLASRNVGLGKALSDILSQHGNLSLSP